ncbi:alanine racemase [Gracilimonas mengyeensis]|uniref:D-serine deaminase, pyridoxal phosphate-dependent n=1 Tax=Gracilimonas mengyeensis TaxID=1302730 RepID=A0A521APV5_9BACT|nr:alanine racemase [Gracilimonas mengyeensis]SMO36859.1 D-serine deaminase, pyridoxal phosphate-dependent [Gracilimonas mengyeensis]
MHPFPTLIVDLDIVRTNIERMTAKAEKADVEFRPHFKTHQSRKIGRMFKDYGVKAITVSSPIMAEYFVEDGWNDITIAFPANVLASSYYHRLASRCNLKTLVISSEIVKKLDKLITEKMGLYIEIDPDYGRSGIPVSQTEKIAEVLNEIEESDHFYPAGFYCHAGHTYKTRSEEEIKELSLKALKKLTALKKKWPDLPLCFGDTPSCSVLDEFVPADQISPGNFVFYDWMQVQIGSCTPNEIAVYMECPVVEKFEDRKQVLVHGGAVHFSKESIQVNDYLSYGEPRLKHLSKATYMKSLSQEHGIVQCSKEVFEQIKVGESLQVFPIHSCLTADLMGQYHTTNGKVLDHLSGT